MMGCGCCCECFGCYDCWDCCKCCHNLYDYCYDSCDCCDKAYCYCCCEKCRYDPDDYDKNVEVFRYCYKAERKCLWCNKFMTNKTQKTIFPFMIEYFILQLTTIGFEKNYEKNKNLNYDRTTWVLVFIGTFIFFFYFTLSFAKFIKGFKGDEDEKEKIEEEEKDKIKEKEKEKIKEKDKIEEEEDKIEEKEKEHIDEKDKEEEKGKIEEKKEVEIKEKDKDKEKKEKNEKKMKEVISKISTDILNGTHGIVLFNCVFSLIFSSFYLSKMPEDTKSFFFKDNINIIFIPILMNKFYYFTLNYYCVYTAEKNNKFDMISTSSLISFYIFIWNIALTLVKSYIPDEDKSENYNYVNILYIIQIVFDSIPSLIVVIFILVLFVYSTGVFQSNCECTESQNCKNTFILHKFLLCLFSFFLCFGGLWIKFHPPKEYEYECCNVGDCCDVGDNCCNVYCIEGTIYCDCCCCARNSSCFSKECDKNCNTCKICGKF